MTARSPSSTTATASPSWSRAPATPGPCSTRRVRADPLFALAHVAHDVLAGLPVHVPEGASTCRGERQHVETVRAWQRGDLRRAHDLRREHLLEYAGDLFVVVLPLVLDSTR